MPQEITHSFTVSAFTSAIANYYPNYIFSQYNSANDSTQRKYFVADGGAEKDFPSALQASLNEIHNNNENFRSYTAEGERHCILQYVNFYYEETNGISFRDWVADLANQIKVENVE